MIKQLYRKLSVYYNKILCGGDRPKTLKQQPCDI